jgi:hypothetical protein
MRRSTLAAFVSSCIAILPAALAQDAPSPPPPEAEKPAEPRGLRRHDPRAFDGYTLISPLESLRTVLLDMEGRIVHEWKSELPPGNSVYLLPNGNLLRCSRILEGEVFEGGGIGGGIEELTWEGDVVWRYRLADELVHAHHDIEPLPNGNILLIAWERKSGTAEVELGRDPSLMDAGEIWPDTVIEIEKTPPAGGKVVWQWRAWDHLVQDFDPDRPNYGKPSEHPGRIDINADRMNPKKPPEEVKAEEEKMRQAGYLGGDAKDARGRPRNVRGADWLHTNGIDYHAGLDQIVLSIPRFDEIWILDHSTTTEEARTSSGGRAGKGGDLLYRYGNPQAYGRGTAEHRVLFRQHDAQWIEEGCPDEGKLIVFNNGNGRPGESYSTVDVIATPVTAEGAYPIAGDAPFTPASPEWSYGGAASERFYSSFISGVQRLPNGNTLICSGADGRIFEITADREIVWDYWNEVGGDAPKQHRGAGREINPFALFRATRLAKNDPGLSRLRSRE